MIVAKTNVEKYLPNNGLFLFILSVLCLISIIVSSLNVWTWLLIVPFVALLFFVFFAGTIKNTKIIKNIGLWLGKYSAFIFVAHPIARSLVLILFKRVHLSCWQLTAIYMVLSLVGAIVYKIVYQAMMNVRVCEKRQCFYFDEQAFTCFFVSRFFDEQAAVLGTIEGLAISVFIFD